MKKLVIAFGVAVVLSFILLGSGLLYLNSRYALDLIEARINRKINGEISIQQHRLAIFQGSLELENCILKGAAARQLAGFKFLRVQWSWKKFLDRTILLNTIIIKEPWVKVKINKKGNLDLAEALQAITPQPKKTEKAVSKENPWNIIIDDLKLSSGSFYATSAPNSMQAKLRGINLSGNVNFLLRQGELFLKINRTKIDTPRVTPLLQKIWLKAKFDKNRLAPFSFNACLGTTCFSLKGTIGSIFSMPELDLIAEISGGDLAEIQKNLHLPTNFSGQAIMQGVLKGTLENPAGTLQLDYSGGKLGDFPVGKAVANLALDNRLLSVRRFNVAIAGGKIDLAGQIDLKTAMVAQDQKLFKFSNLFLDLNKIACQFDLKAENLQADRLLRRKDLKGECQIAAKLSGSLQQPNANLLIKAHNFSFALNDHQIKIDGDLNFNLNGFYNLKTKDFKAALLFQDTDPGVYLAAAGLKELSGRLTGKIEATGNADQLDGIKAKVDLSDIKLFLKNKPLLNSNSFKANYQNKTFSISQGKFFLLKNGWLTLSGAGKLQGSLAFSLDGLIPLKAAYFFIKEPEELEGNLHISATLRGLLPQPEISAAIGLENVGMLIPVIEQQLGNINGTILLTPGQLEIKKAITGQMDEGRFELTGSLGLEKWQPQKADFLLTAHKIPLEVPDLLDLVFNTSLSIKGTKDNQEIKGDVILLDGTYYKDVKLNLLQGISQKKRKVKPPFQNYDQSIFNNLKLDIALKSRSPFKVDNNLAKLSLTPDLHLAGTVKRPLISGRARVDSGKIIYRKKNFIVRKGVVDFVNPYKLVLELDILSEVNIRTWKIYLKVSGTPEDLLLTLRSDPPEEDEDVLSLLLFGKTSQELIEDKGNVSKSTQQLLAELIEGILGEDIKKIAGIDILEVETTDGVEEEEFDPERVEVTVGKKLSRRLTVKYAVESKNDELNQKAISEYQFFDQIFVNGFQDDRGNYGGGLILRIEFR
ncbi:MAG: translocation/assembly module TamB domain-containing protein [Deltaproteobacteria bacterium]|nr:translocation/assembly module TamB domain-containing protein [Deltaproteobacteria bacterium]